MLWVEKLDQETKRRNLGGNFFLSQTKIIYRKVVQLIPSESNSDNWLVSPSNIKICISIKCLHKNGVGNIQNKPYKQDCNY